MRSRRWPKRLRGSNGCSTGNSCETKPGATIDGSATFEDNTRPCIWKHEKTHGQRSWQTSANLLSIKWITPESSGFSSHALCCSGSGPSDSEAELQKSWWSPREHELYTLCQVQLRLILVYSWPTASSKRVSWLAMIMLVGRD